MWTVNFGPQTRCILRFQRRFDRLAYRCVENDPRKLEDVHKAVWTLYGDLAMAYVRTRRYENAMTALKTRDSLEPK